MSLQGTQYETKSIPNVLLEFNGRIGRRDFWVKGFLVLMALALALGFVFGVLWSAAPELAILLLIVGYAVGLWMSAAILVKRLHDLGHSGWWWLLILVPYVGLGLIGYCGVARSDDINKYGVPPT